MTRKMIARCPFCSEELSISRLHCSHCQTQIDTQLAIPAFFRLPEDLQAFVLLFLRCRGNIKEVERELGISYPTVSKKLDAINLLLATMVGKDAAKARILRQLEAGDLGVAEAVRRLNEQTHQEGGA